MHNCFATLPCDALEIKETLSGPPLDSKVLLHCRSLMKLIIKYMSISLFFSSKSFKKFAFYVG